MPKASIGDDPARPGALTDGIGIIVAPLIGAIVGGFRKDLIEGLFAALAVFFVYLSLYLYRGHRSKRIKLALIAEIEQAKIEISSNVNSPERLPLDVLPRILNAKYKEMRKTVIENNPEFTSEHMMSYDSQVEDLIAKIEILSLAVVSSENYDHPRTSNNQLSSPKKDDLKVNLSEDILRSSLENSIKKSLKTGPKNLTNLLKEVMTYEEIKESLTRKSIVQEYVEGVALHSGGLVEFVDLSVRISDKWYLAEMVLDEECSDEEILDRFAEFSPTIEIKLDVESGCVYLFRVEGIYGAGDDVHGESN